MKTFGSFYVSALLVSTTTFSLCIRPYKYIQHCKSYFKNQNYIKGQLVSVLLCLDRVSQRTSSYVFPVRNCHLFIRFVRSFVRSFIYVFMHSSLSHSPIFKVNFETHEIMKFIECYHVAKKKNINRRELNRKQRCLELCGFEVLLECPWILLIVNGH